MSEEEILPQEKKVPLSLPKINVSTGIIITLGIIFLISIFYMHNYYEDKLSVYQQGYDLDKDYMLMLLGRKVCFDNNIDYLIDVQGSFVYQSGTNYLISGYTDVICKNATSRIYFRSDYPNGTKII